MSFSNYENFQTCFLHVSYFINWLSIGYNEFIFTLIFLSHVAENEGIWKDVFVCLESIMTSVLVLNAIYLGWRLLAASE